MLSAVIFDFDQTLADTKQAHYLALVSALKSCGYPEKKIEWLYGKTSEEILKHNFRQMSEEDIAKVASFKKQRLIRFIKYIRLLPHAVKLLIYLKKRKIRLALVTNNTHREIDELIKHLGLEGFFEVLVGKEDAPPKPSPEPVILAIKSLKLPPEQIVFVGDSNPDIESSKAAGLRIIINTQVHKSDTNLEKADWAVSNISEIEKILRTLVSD